MGLSHQNLKPVESYYFKILPGNPDAQPVWEPASQLDVLLFTGLPAALLGIQVRKRRLMSKQTKIWDFKRLISFLEPT